ncbi:hypothetical protein BVX99_03525 [bacterium F16]|nr:hypothetical protein BVX99_03525 [bacterium F16]
MKVTYTSLIGLMVSVCCHPEIHASISGKSLYLIVSNGIQAARVCNVPAEDEAGLLQVLTHLTPHRTSSNIVSSETETEARKQLSGLKSKYGDPFDAAFFAAFSLPDRETATKHVYPRPGRVKLLADLVSNQRASNIFNTAYRKKVRVAAQKKYGRPANGDVITLYINKRNVTGRIQYHETTFEIGMVTFPNKDLPANFNPDLIKTQKDEYFERHFTQRHAAYQRKVALKIQAAALHAGHYLLLDGEWFSPKAAYPSLSYFLTSPETPPTAATREIIARTIPERIQAGNNPVTMRVAQKLLTILEPKQKADPKNTITPAHYDLLLTHWKTSHVARQYVKLNEGLPLSDAPQETLYNAALRIVCTLLMEP